MSWWYQDIRDLREAGFVVEEMNPWHFQVVGEKLRVNIWPTKKKFMIEYGDGASYYTDVVETVDQILNPKKSAVQRSQEAFSEIHNVEVFETWKQGIKEFRKKRHDTD